MGKIDEVKEILNTLRIWLSLTIGLVVITTGGLISRFDQQKIDTVFVTGSILLIVLIMVVLLIVLKISTKTKEIKDL
jgi:uncharacterized membrane protein